MVDFLPPTRAIVLALVVAAAVSVGVAAAWAVGGPSLAAAAAISGVGMLPMAARKASLVDAGAFVALTAALAALAGVFADSAVALSLLVAAAALAAAPFTIRYGPLGLALPVVVLVIGAQLHGVRAWEVALAVIGMALILAAVVVVLRLPRREGAAVAAPVAWTHAIVLALTAGLATLFVLSYEVGHGVWVVFGLCAVLAPDVESTFGEARARVVGTLIGGVVAAVVAIALPAALALMLAVPALVLATAHSIAGQRRRFAGYTTALVVLVAAAAVPGHEWDIALTRVGFIAAGALVAALAARFVIARTQASASSSRQPSASGEHL